MIAVPRNLLFLLLFTSIGAAQEPAVPLRGSPNSFVNYFHPEQVDLWMSQHDSQARLQQLQSSSASVSVLDLKAPKAARREFDKGLQFLIHRNFSSAVECLAKATTIYPHYVAAHSALGAAYLELGQNEEAREEFERAVRLDDHLPGSYRNLGRAELALNHYSAAEEALRKASSISPLDIPLLTALTHAEFMNHDFAGAVATAQQVHSRKHEGAAIVHYFAAASWQRQKNLQETRQELQTLLAEDPNSPVAETARHLVEQITQQENSPAAPVEISSYAVPGEARSVPGEIPEQFQRKMRQLQQEKQVADAEIESAWESCGPPGAASPFAADIPHGPDLVSPPRRRSYPGWIVRSSVDEVALFFAVTDHGKSVSDLTRDEISIRDDRKPPAAVLEFRNESQLPLRLGLVIDTSASIEKRLSFEQGAATDFMHRVVTDKNDLAFVVGFSNSVLVVQDFTNDQKQISHGVSQLAPAGGTAAWDAVSFAAEKLASLPEERPVARILVVITDGDDNSSSATLKEAIEAALRAEVIVYTVSTKENSRHETTSPVGDRALKALAARTGGAAFFPGSLGRLNQSLEELQQVIRSRYLISYRPTLFSRDGQYRTIDISAQKAGRKLRVYARRGYYATTKSAREDNF